MTTHDLEAARNWLTLCGGALLDLGGTYCVCDWAEAREMRHNDGDDAGLAAWEQAMHAADYDETKIATPAR